MLSENDGGRRKKDSLIRVTSSLRKNDISLVRASLPSPPQTLTSKHSPCLRVGEWASTRRMSKMFRPQGFLQALRSPPMR